MESQNLRAGAIWFPEIDHIESYLDAHTIEEVTPEPPEIEEEEDTEETNAIFTSLKTSHRVGLGLRYTYIWETIDKNWYRPVCTILYIERTIGKRVSKDNKYLFDTKLSAVLEKRLQGIIYNIDDCTSRFHRVWRKSGKPRLPYVGITITILKILPEPDVRAYTRIVEQEVKKAIQEFA